MAGHRSRLWPAIVVVAVAAGAATLILRPRTGLIEPAAVEATAYFSPAQLERADDFRELQRLLALAGMVVSGATLAWLALCPPRRVLNVLERARDRPVRAGAAAGAGVVVALTLAGLPLAIWRHERAVDFGLSTQALGDWFSDLGKATAIEAIVAAAGGALAIWLVRRFPRRWFIPGAAVVVAFAAGSLYLQPILIDPLFNRFDKLPHGELRSEVLQLADRAGVDVGEVYRVDASRRTTTINAYVGGLGHTKRVVLYDNLIDDYPRDELLSVVAHELGHVRYDDVPRGLLWIAIVAPAGVLLIQRLAERLAGGALVEDRRPVARAVPALALAVGLVSLALTIVGNSLSRRVEARADAFALEQTRDPEAFIALERSLALRNLAQPDPPELFHRLFGTHPPTLERIGYAVTSRRALTDGR